MTLEGPGGQDPTKGIKEAALDSAKEVTGEAMTVWHAQAQDRLTEAAEGRADIDAQRDSRGDLEGRKENSLYAITQSFTAPQWTGDAWTFDVTHAAAVFHEWGAQPHEIQARKAEALAFEWPDAPEEIQERYNFDDPTADDYQTVFFDNVDHPGVPAIGFLRHGREQARSRLENAGYSARGFGFDSDGSDEGGS